MQLYGEECSPLVCAWPKLTLDTAICSQPSALHGVYVLGCVSWPYYNCICKCYSKLLKRELLGIHDCFSWVFIIDKSQSFSALRATVQVTCFTSGWYYSGKKQSAKAKCDIKGQGVLTLVGAEQWRSISANCFEIWLCAATCITSSAVACYSFYVNLVLFSIWRQQVVVTYWLCRMQSYRFMVWLSMQSFGVLCRRYNCTRTNTSHAVLTSCGTVR